MATMKTVIVDGAKIERHRALAGMTQSRLATKLRVDQSTISQWESGRRSPSVPNFKRLCKALGVDSAALIVDEPEAGAA